MILHQKLKTLSMTVLAAAGLFMAASSAQAALTASAGNLYMGFQTDTNSEGSVLINLGSAAQFRDGTTTGQIANLSSLDTILSAAFGNNWDTRSDLHVGLAGWTQLSALGNDPGRTVYASRPETTFGTQSTAWGSPTALFASEVQAIYSNMSNVKGTAGVSGFLNGVEQAGSTNVVFQDSALTNSWAYWQEGGDLGSGNFRALDFGAFSPTSQASFGLGASNVALDLYRLVSATDSALGNTIGVGSYEGTFTFDSNGGVFFNTSVPGAAPEPSRLVLAAAGLGALLFRRRRASVL